MTPVSIPRPRYIVALLAASAFWVIDSLIDFFLQTQAESLWESFLPNETNEIYMRTLVVVLLGGCILLLERLALTTRRSEYVLRNIVENTTDAYLSIDNAGCITYVNGNAEQLLGIEHDRILGKRFLACFPDAESFHAGFISALNEARAVDLEGHYAAKNLHLQVHTRPFVGGMSIFFRDITELMTRERELTEANSHLQAILDGASDGIVTINGRGIIRTFNRSAAHLFGYEPEEVMGHNVAMLVGSEETLQFLNDFLSAEQIDDMSNGPREVIARRRDGTSVTIELAIGEILLGEERHFVGIVRNIEERKRAVEALRLSEEGLARAQAIAHLGSWQWDIEAGTLHWSDEVFRIFGQPVAAFVPTYDMFLEHIHPEDRAAVSAAVNAALEGQPYAIEHRIMRLDGEWRYVHEQGEVVHDASGRAKSMIGTVQDVTEWRRVQETIEFMTHFDALTKLPNRSLMQYRLSQAISRAHREHGQVAVVLLDIDRFKQLNDTLGHATGDAFLKSAAERLTGAVREGDTVARLGGDEFALILDDAGEVERITDQLQRLRHALQAPLLIAGHEFYPTASLGVSVYPFDGDDAETLLRHADTALQRAKDEGNGSLQFFTADMTAESAARLRLEADLRHAFMRGEFELHYQPQVTTAGHRVVGFEALLRWRQGERPMPPAQFVPVLEDIGLIVQVGDWVLTKACIQAKHWLDTGMEARIAVNLSARQFRQPDFLQRVESALAGSGLPPQLLELEITESLLVEDIAGTIEILSALQARGVRVAIDDFGTGYSSMAYLQRLPVHSLKIDRSFITDVTQHEDAAAIVGAILALAHSLRLRVIAEGVESAEQLAFLNEHGCEEVQGYYFSKALPPEQIRPWVEGFRQPTAAMG